MNTPTSWKTILVPTDFSEASEPAIAAAAEMNRQSGCQIILLHVTEEASKGLRVQTYELHQQMKQEAGQKLTQVLREAFGEAVTARCIVAEGAPAEAICDTARAEGVDVIIIPTHGRTGLKKVLLGSVAEKVVRLASCSVLVVRD
jgi:nucleotide-binding universal stress UspA family protein